MTADKLRWQSPNEAAPRDPGSLRELALADPDTSSKFDQLTSLQDVAGALLKEVDPKRVLSLIATHAKELTHGQTAAIAKLTAPDKLRLDVVVGRGASAARNVEVEVEGSMAGIAMMTGRSQLVPDIESESWLQFPVAKTLCARSTMIAPLCGEAGPVGVICVTHGEANRFAGDDLRLLDVFASFACIALRNAHLFQAHRDAAQAEAERAVAASEARAKGELLAGMMRAQEEERARIARDLHDAGAQALTSVLLGLKVAEQGQPGEDFRRRLADLREVTSQAIREVRQIAVALRPPVLDDLGLQAALNRQANEFQTRSGIRVRVRLAKDAPQLLPEVQTAVYRVVQEALSNVGKHANASTVSVTSTYAKGTLRVRVRDDGCGFDPSAPCEGLGIKGMCERVQLAGGRFRVRSAPGSGAVVEMELPT
ncbi:MAG TPA: GAF domain-containing sensor histidine kinase [Actinomycetota bacterium]|nr:GAF domain-containing sensor histidine kinase [Actinomycetota bacterium]